MKKTNKGFVTKVEGDVAGEVIEKLRNLKRYWEWADKLKDQHRFYAMQEEKNAKLKSPNIFKRDSTMFFGLYLAVVSQMLKAFDEEPKIELAGEIKDVKERMSINIGKFGEAMCNPGKSLLDERMMIDAMKPMNSQIINALHVNIGYFIDKKIQELRNKDYFPYAMTR